ncbi:MAG TPA: DUF502 domain-containing protein [Candidatus Bathyarchaeia archaeon]|nr:DUF502 domain-containing protein [Candidatus Bathyarchaeia archaeon]
MKVSRPRPIRRLVAYFLQGLVFVVPIGAIAYGLWFLFVEVDTWINVEPLLNRRVPGAGIVLTVLLVTAVGFLASNFATRWLFSAFEDVVARTPLLKLLYTSLKDLVGAFVGETKRFDRPVLVQLGASPEVSTIGFVTREALGELGLPDHVAVYVPQAYNIGGNVVVVPRTRIRPLDADPGTVMSFVVSGGITGEVGASAKGKRK